jgi:CheY-like chemotaxis protein
MPAPTTAIVRRVYATTAARDTCLRAGMNGFPTKPPETEKLRSLLAELAAPGSAPRSNPASRVW